MGRKKHARIEFRFYELPPAERVLSLMGDDWVGVYGNKERPAELHFHNLFEFGHCLRGTGTLIIGETRKDYQPDSFTLLPANYPHNTISNGVNAWEYLYFDPAQLVYELFPNDPRLQAEKLATLEQRADLLSAADCPPLATLASRIFEELREKRPYYQQAVHHLLYAFLLELLRMQEQRGPEPYWAALPDAALVTQISPALRYVEGHYREPIRAAHLARECGLSEVHFRRVFEDNMNMTPMDYVNHIRVQKACDLMGRSDSPMDVIALECGFVSVSTFTRNFKKVLKTTPYQWKLNKDNLRSNHLSYNISALRGWERLESQA